jgi:hypothetical protein
MHPYRVFVAHSHEDRELTLRVAELLERMGLRPMWDKDFLPGAPFTDQIKKGIAHSHVFLPLLTKSSSQRPWVHQEIGYAMGHDVPVLPLAIGELPGEMIRELQGISVATGLDDLEDRLAARTVEQVVLRAHKKSQPTFHCAYLPEERTAMLAEYAKDVLDLGFHGRVRQSGAFTSFCLPRETVGHPIWMRREGRFPRPDAYHRLQRAERLALEQHAREAGCDLVLDLSVTLKQQGPDARKARLDTLLKFLRSMPEDNVRVVVRKRADPLNLLIVGDWFVAESTTPRPRVGYLQTVFTRHAPTVLDQLREFDDCSPSATFGICVGSS